MFQIINEILLQIQLSTAEEEKKNKKEKRNENSICGDRVSENEKLIKNQIKIL